MDSKLNKDTESAKPIESENFAEVTTLVCNSIIKIVCYFYLIFPVGVAVLTFALMWMCEPSSLPDHTLLHTLYLVTLPAELWYLVWFIVLLRIKFKPSAIFGYCTILCIVAFSTPAFFLDFYWIFSLDLKRPQDQFKEKMFIGVLTQYITFLTHSCILAKAGKNRCCQSVHQTVTRNNTALTLIE